MKPKNLPTRVYARRMGALKRLDPKHPDAAILRERTQAEPVNYETKKHLATGSYARRQHHQGKMTR